MMRVICRFECQSVLRQTHAEEVTLAAVYSSKEGSPNFSWSAATPNGKLTMTITNKAVWGQFVPGQKYDITLSPSPVES